MVFAAYEPKTLAALSSKNLGFITACQVFMICYTASVFRVYGPDLSIERMTLSDAGMA